MFADPNGPIEHFTWGTFVIAGTEHSDDGVSEVGKGKDISLIGTTVKRWKQRKGHLLQEDMVQGVFGRGIKVLVIGNGVDGALDVPERVVHYLLAHGISEVIVKKTPAACAAYNKLYHQGERVALLAHGTC